MNEEYLPIITQREFLKKIMEGIKDEVLDILRAEHGVY